MQKTPLWSLSKMFANLILGCMHREKKSKHSFTMMPLFGSPVLFYALYLMTVISTVWIISYCDPQLKPVNT